MTDPNKDEEKLSAGDGGVQERREFLLSTGKWSAAAIMAVVSGVWVGTGPNAHARGAWLNRRVGGGGWANGGVMGDRRWFDHVIEFDVPANGQVVVLIRVKSKWNAPKDFFVDAARLEPASNARGDLAPGHGRIYWGAADYPDQVDYWGWLAAEQTTTDGRPPTAVTPTPTP